MRQLAEQSITLAKPGCCKAPGLFLQSESNRKLLHYIKLPNMAEITWRQAIDQVLAATAAPLHYSEITKRIIEEGLRDSLGATPAATVNAQISNSIKKDGIHSP